ncbi:MAG TPA: hypothetical protein VF889_05565 [Bacteroidota bacterium]
MPDIIHRGAPRPVAPLNGPLLEQAPLGVIVDQTERPAAGIPRLRGSPEAA